MLESHDNFSLHCNFDILFFAIANFNLLFFNFLNISAEHCDYHEKNYFI